MGSRSGDTARRLIGGYRGAMQTDGYEVYQSFENAPDKCMIGCWAHVRRKFVEALDEDRKHAGEVTVYISRLYKLKTDMKEAGLGPDAIRERREKEAYPVIRDFEKWMNSVAGRELMERKVKLVSVMAGNFRENPEDKFPEYNVVRDIPSAQKFFAECPSPIAVSPFELGWEICYPAEEIEKNLGYGTPNPVVEAYKVYIQMPYSRPIWDLTSVLYAVEGSEKFSPIAGKFSHMDEKFVESPSGRVCIDDSGMSSFIEDSESLQTVLKVDPEDRLAVLDRLVELTVRR